MRAMVHSMPPQISSGASRLVGRARWLGCLDLGGVSLLPGKCFVDAPERGQGLPCNLIHVVVTVRREPADKPDVFARGGKCFVALIELGAILARYRIRRIAVSARIFVGDAGFCMRLAGQMLVFGDPRVVVRLRIVNDRHSLVPRLIETDVLE